MSNLLVLTTCLVVRSANAVPSGWEEIPTPGVTSKVTQVAARGGYDLPIWIIDNDKNLYEREATGGADAHGNPEYTWTQRKNNVIHVDVGFDNSTWYINTDRHYFRRKYTHEAGKWDQHDPETRLIQLSAKSYYEIVGVDHTGQAWHWVANQWRKLVDEDKSIWAVIGADSSILSIRKDTNLSWRYDWPDKKFVSRGANTTSVLEVYSLKRYVDIDLATSRVWEKKDQDWIRHEVLAVDVSISRSAIYAVEKDTGKLYRKAV